MNDKCGREIHKGDQVDIYLSDIVLAHVVEVRQGGIANLQGQVQPDILLLQVVIPMRINGGVAPVYVVRAAPVEEPEEKQVVM